MKAVFITGASSGIGEATAQYFVEQGWRVFATARHPEKLGSWSRASQVTTLPLDITKPESVRSAVADALRDSGGLDVLINNAGVGLEGPLEAITGMEMEEHFQTNLFGTVRMIQEVLPIFESSGVGVIVNVSSVSGRFEFVSLAILRRQVRDGGMSESLYYELRPFNIRIKLVEPGGTRTNFWQVFSQHEAYEPGLSAVKTRMDQGAGSLPGPESVARVIFKAATDGSERLRYPVKTQGASLSPTEFFLNNYGGTIVRKSFAII